MQVGKVSWVGQTFALARCSDSQGKKPRSRRTKEERRKMVESFISRYRDSNNGSFPSLNLTHKEVGGSFYTVREIVREIIQENRVLRPGSLNSKALNFDDCSEQLPEHFTLDHPYNLSMMTIEDSIDERQKEGSHCNEKRNINEVLSTFSDYNTSDIKGEFALHSHHIPVPQVIDGASFVDQHCKSQYGNVDGNVDSTNEESSESLIKLPGIGQNNSTTPNDEVCMAVKDNGGENHAKYEIRDPVGFSEPLSLFTSVGSITKDTKTEMHISDTNKEMCSPVEIGHPFNESDVGDKVDNTSSSGNAGEIYTLQSTGPMVSGSEQISKEKAGSLDDSGVTEPGVIANENMSYMPVYSGSTINSIERLSSTTADQKAAASVNAPIVDVADCPTDESIRLQVQPSVASDGLHMEAVALINRRASGETKVENCIGNPNTAGESTLDGTSRESPEPNEQTENAQANPLVAFIKGLVTALIKFWTE